MSCFECILQFIVQLYYIIISSFVSKLESKKTLICIKEPNIGSGTFNRISSSLDSQAVKEVPKPIEQVQPNFPTNAQLHFSIFCFLFFERYIF